MLRGQIWRARRDSNPHKIQLRYYRVEAEAGTDALFRVIDQIAEVLNPLSLDQVNDKVC